MRQMNESERSKLSKSKATFGEFIVNGPAILQDFFLKMGFVDALDLASNAEKFLERFDLALRNEEFIPEMRAWILMRIGFYLGEVLRQKFRGRWMIDQDPDSLYFAHWVVGDFENLPVIASRVSPLAVAAYFVDGPTPRSLTKTYALTERGLRDLFDPVSKSK